MVIQMFVADDDCFEHEEDIGHLEYEKHPGDAEGDEGAEDEGEDPHLNEFHDDRHQFVRWAKCLREDERAALNIKKIRILESNSNEKMMEEGLNP